MRPFIEYTELLTFFKAFPEMVQRAETNDLPKAGERAKAIKGDYADFRKHLNEHASHSSYSRYSLAHLKDPNTGRFKKLQRLVPSVLDKNIQDLTVQVYFLLREGVVAMERVAGAPYLNLAAATDELKLRLIREFETPA